jgi:hypothetical protein
MRREGLMKVCYVCSEFIKTEGEGDKGTICPACEVNYCFKCSATLNSCNICGSEITPYYPEFDPALKLKKTSFSKLRNYPRKDYVSTVEYLVASETPSSESVKQVKAVTKNISRGGMCIYTQEEHKKGQRIKITECAICSDQTDAEVRWSHKIDDSIFRAGLMFIN